MKSRTQKIVISALLASLTCIATMIIKIPLPLKGYMNLGDCTVLLCGWVLSPCCGFLAAGLGSALADIFSGYAVYAPATFIIKGLMDLAAYFIFKVLYKKINSTFARIVSAFIAELIMAVGYFIFEGFLYGFAASMINIPANIAQGTAGMILGILFIKIFDKNKSLTFM